MNKFLTIFAILFTFCNLNAQKKQHQKGHTDTNKFRQFKSEWATPNDQRTASGAPGHNYKQQQVDYIINVRLDEKKDKIYGEETITYHNNSNDKLEYLWLQLDQNIRAKNSKSFLIKSDNSRFSNTLYTLVEKEKEDFGFKIEKVSYENGKNLSHTINATMMRINLQKPLEPNKKFTFKIKWNYLINNYLTDGSRSGFEDFKDGNKAYVIAQFFPRLCVYNNVEGWQNMQFWGNSEFALEFGDYQVNITVPADHILEATGILQNENEVLTKTQQNRYKKARKTFDKPIFIVTEKEAVENSKGRSKNTKTWKFKAEKVRDFAFASSRKYMWDAMAVDINGKTIMATSLYPKEGNPLWEEHSTKIVANTLKVYSKMTFDYPYPKAVSVNAKDQGMEYPMICFNHGRPRNKNYSNYLKNKLIGVISHEVGHNFFPMIVNSDERQWTWMDEGLNSFVEMIAEQKYDPNYPIKSLPRKIVGYMSLDQNRLTPIMSQGDYIKNFGPNAYYKPAAGLWMLRNTILGKELFDYAFSTYAKRWAFKHPAPEDFFRTMEDASGTDLDWFWRGWFYTTDYNDVSIKNVVETKVDTESLEKYISTLSENEQKNLKEIPKYTYKVEFEKLGGLVLPLIVELTYTDGSKKRYHYPAEIWRKNDKTIFKIYKTTQKINKITIDPDLETADIDVTNNSWPKKKLNKFEKFKSKN